MKLNITTYYGCVNCYEYIEYRYIYLVSSTSQLFVYIFRRSQSFRRDNGCSIIYPPTYQNDLTENALYVHSAEYIISYGQYSNFN